MLDDNELARMIFGKHSEPNVTKTVTGTVIEDSSEGYVTVSLGDSVIEIPTTADVREGDSVIVSITGNDPVVTGTVGGGDRTRNSITAIANYFWHDSAGAHVSTQEYSTEGRNLLATSSGLYICTGSTVESSFTDSFAQIGRDNQSHLTIESKKLAFLTGSATDGAAFKVETERTGTDLTYDNVTISASSENDADFSQLFIEGGRTAKIDLLGSESHRTADTDCDIRIIASTSPDAPVAEQKSYALQVTENGVFIGDDSSGYLELNRIYSWHQIAHVVGSDSAQLSDISINYSDFMIVADINRNGALHTLSATFPIQRIGSAAHEFKLGGGEGASEGTSSGAWVSLSKTSFAGVAAAINRQSFLSSTDFYLYAR